MKYIIGLIAVLVIINLYPVIAWRLAVRRYNKGVCPKCGRHLRHYATTKDGIKWYVCDKCNYETIKVPKK